MILSSIANDKKNEIKTKITNDYKALVEEIKENTNIQIIIKDKSQEEVLNLYKPINELKALANDLRNKEEAIQANRVSHMKYELGFK